MNAKLEDLNQARALARALFLQNFPQADQWFDLAWKTASSQQRQWSSTQGELLTGLGIATDKDAGADHMIRDFVIFYEAFTAQFPAAIEAILERLEASGQRHGKNPRAIERLKLRLTEHLSKEPEKEIGSVFFVECLERGAHEPATRKSEKQIEEILQGAEYDIIVNETSRIETIFIRNKSIEKIRPAATKMRGMLWLIMHNAPTTGQIKYDEIENLFGESSMYERDRDGKIYSYRKRLNKWLTARLANIIFEEGAGKTYYLRRKGWSFCWIRPQKDQQESVLLYRVQATRPEENQ